jgi:beta-lactam-binding protein with PASTA domain
VLRQEPTAGTPAAKGTQIKLVVAEKGVLIPKLVGKRLTQAKSLLEKGGFHLGEVRTREHAEYSGGRILEQSPDAGAMVARGANVDLVVVAPD